MADLVNPYANPYLPSFVNQRPRIDNQAIPIPMNQPVSAASFVQIRSVHGFDGARNYAANNLLPGSSDIISENDPNTMRIYIVAKDQNNQTIVEGFRLIPEEEPKPVTMDDLNSKMSELLDRMNKLEEERNNDKSGSESSWKTPRKSNDSRIQSGNGNGSGYVQPSGSNTANDAK